MLKRERIKSRLELENEEKSEILQNFVILLSDDDDEDEEANKDLTLEIVERAKRREANKRKREEGFNEVKVSSSSSDGPDGDVFRSSGVIDVASSSSDEIIGLDRIAGDLIVPEVKKKKKKARRSRKKKTDSEANIVDNVVEEPVKTVTPVEAEAIGVIETEAIGVVKTEELVDPVKGVEISETKAVEISDNIVLRKLLRGPRYFDPPNRSFSTCYNCGEEGHLAVNCSSKKRKKPCFICGSFEHGVRNCTQITVEGWFLNKYDCQLSIFILVFRGMNSLTRDLS
ncbi:hypothetical protein GIB67_034258 [Kingdonia uniflora]|uniref:CCHC-type domain-containing protein n=1 Tax=Kingdonia uniflora TaxID=39325 RepID=A0A7J7NRR3_9MAGN|nr:hypothetical protein GIB67_034258 [Kingdonia uniflora]